MLSHVTTASGVRIAVQDLGTGPAIVMLAGFGLDHTVWDGQVAALAATHRTLCIDLRGTGESDKPLNGYRLEQFVDDVIDVVDQLAADSFDLIGWSFGGQVGFEIARRYPERVTRLVLIGSNGVRACRDDRFPFGGSRERLEPALRAGEHGNRPLVRRDTIAHGFAHPPASAVLDFLTGIFLRMPPWAAIETYHTMFDIDLIAAADSLSLPVRIITGSHDRVHPIAGARWLVEQLPDAELHEIPDCGHYPMFENPAELDRLLHDTLGIALPGAR
ncbi:alpha/beta fold hydrolase [Nocardia sp. R6R-6]|uniref:alpha/beta fold hydrolase n=1 Tax=Nocardia sp. R6R-6 TaxID=3459303 RepID=UPI00403E288E